MIGLVLRLIQRRLRFAEQKDVIGTNGVAWRKIRETTHPPDFVALENPRIALDSLHQRTGLALFGCAALAEAAAGEPRPELIDVLGRPRKVMRGIVISVHGKIGFDPLEPGHHAGEGTHMLAKTRDCAPRGDGAISTARHE
jgi:hypothetical protein